MCMGVCVRVYVCVVCDVAQTRRTGSLRPLLLALWVLTLPSNTRRLLSSRPPPLRLEKPECDFAAISTHQPVKELWCNTEARAFNLL